MLEERWLVVLLLAEAECDGGKIAGFLPNTADRKRMGDGAS